MKQKLIEVLPTIPNGKTPQRLRLMCILASRFDPELDGFRPSFEETELLQSPLIGGAIVDTLLTRVEISLDKHDRIRYVISPNDNTFGNFITYTNG